MVSDIFDYKQLMETSNFGIKIYKTGTYKGLINEENKREGFGVYIAENGIIYEGEWLKDKRNG
jgi:beta-glucosidase/6-phospho-beta-glucosidase/beta-galactosidase